MCCAAGVSARVSGAFEFGSPFGDRDEVLVARSDRDLATTGVEHAAGHSCHGVIDSRDGSGAQTTAASSDRACLAIGAPDIAHRIHAIGTAPGDLSRGETATGAG